jgi:hypothetical protein
MSLILDGTNGLSDVDGSAATPAIRGTDTNTGIFFPAADTIAFSEGGAEVMRLTSAGDVAIGNTSALVTSSGRKVVTINGTTDAMYNIGINGTYTAFLYSSASNTQIGSATSIPLQFYTGDTERMRITSGGNLEMASNAGILQTATNQTIRMPSSSGIGYIGNINSSSTFQIAYNSTGAGVSLGSGATSWGTFSDSRLKNVTGTYTNALNDIAQIQAVKFTWKSDEDNKPQVGVIAQSVETVVPESVEESTIEMDGTEKYLQVRYTELIPLMIASIQELNAKLDAQALEIAELKAKP